MIIKRKAQNLNTSLRPKLNLRNAFFCIKFLIQTLHPNIAKKHLSLMNSTGVAEN
jgi:hypothetical protein